MTFNSKETSVSEGVPVNLYEFNWGLNTVRLTGADRDIEFNSATWVSCTINMTGVEQTQDLNRAGVTMDVDLDKAMVRAFEQRPPDEVMTVTVWKYHYPDLPADAVVLWAGRVLGVSWSLRHATMQCEPISTSMRQTGLRRFYQQSCPHLLYGRACGVQRATYLSQSEVTTVDGKTIIVTGFASSPEGHWVGGYVQRIDPVTGDNQYRMIVNQAADLLTLDAAFIGLTPPETLDFYPGCRRVMTDCDTKFANILNFGGFPWVPDKNPFSTSVY